METIVATAFGQRVEVQNGEASELVDAASQLLSSFKDEESFGPLEATLMLCKHTNQSNVVCPDNRVLYVHTFRLKFEVTLHINFESLVAQLY